MSLALESVGKCNHVHNCICMDNFCISDLNSDVQVTLVSFGRSCPAQSFNTFHSNEHCVPFPSPELSREKAREEEEKRSGQEEEKKRETASEEKLQEQQNQKKEKEESSSSQEIKVQDVEKVDRFDVEKEKEEGECERKNDDNIVEQKKCEGECKMSNIEQSR
ncbi:hypothetical protein Pcinc_035254 [Petrolisthes cinctipes]|uniref:Uncharacterized protein n=1 Tax=Petrolisthes cinctipes TaxID=88211 RepID=A0AAE1ENX3_PETCI|nr:hypothetical protein Pcinc_035254 [Petrolisthes cinctipes]